MAYSPDHVVDYGTATSQTIVEDRFGINQSYRSTMSHGIPQDFVATNVRGVVKRLGLVLRGCHEAYYRVRHYFMEVDDRALEIRTYADGRVKLFLDGVPVYTENIHWKVVQGMRQRHRRAEHTGDALQRQTMDLLHTEALIENARRDLGRRQQMINKLSIESGT